MLSAIFNCLRSDHGSTFQSPSTTVVEPLLPLKRVPPASARFRTRSPCGNNKSCTQSDAREILKKLDIPREMHIGPARVRLPGGTGRAHGPLACGSLGRV